jgi:hypothetical protein
VTTLRARWKLVVSVTVTAVAAVAVILAATAFNSSGSGGSTTAAGASEQAILDFAQCMRDNGVPSFPDPVARPDGTFALQRPVGVPASVLDDALASCQSEAAAIGLDVGSAAPNTDAPKRRFEDWLKYAERG